MNHKAYSGGDADGDWSGCLADRTISLRNTSLPLSYSRLSSFLLTSPQGRKTILQSKVTFRKRPCHSNGVDDSATVYGVTDAARQLDTAFFV